MKWISGHRHPKGSRGHVALEALVGFLLLGAMMALYLPALHQAYQRLEDSQVASQEWRLAQFGESLRVEVSFTNGQVYQTYFWLRPRQDESGP